MRAREAFGNHAWTILAIVLTAIAQVELWLLWQPDVDEATGPVSIGVRALAAAGTLPLTLSLALGRRWPLLPLALAIPAIAVLPGGPLEVSVAVVGAIVVAALAAALLAPSATEIGIGAGGIAALVVTTAIAHPDTVEEPGDLALLVAALVGPWLAGLAIRARRERETALESLAVRAEASRQADAQRAVTDERARIARELHDVVAHAISVIVLQARGGRRAIASDPAAATQALDDIEMTGSRALAEMRRLVGVLRPGDAANPGAGALEPPPGLGALEALVAGVRDAGLEVTVQVEGTPVELAPGVDLAAYRLVQEAFTNTLRHAEAVQAKVILRYVPGAIEIEVVDEGRPEPAAGQRPQPADVASGHGMIGMRERAALYGGSVEFGPRPDGGFRVLARLPVGGDPA
jgi:signal transduction histidine kinase